MKKEAFAAGEIAPVIWSGKMLFVLGQPERRRAGATVLQPNK